MTGGSVESITSGSGTWVAMRAVSDWMSWRPSRPT